MTARVFYCSAAAVLVLAICYHIFFFSRGFYSIGWDESGRTLDAYAWASHGTELSRAWLPFYRICAGLALRTFPDLFLTPRIIVGLYGLASILAAAWLSHELFQSRRTTLLTLLLSGFFSQRVALSLAPLSDIMFISVILLTMALFARWSRSGSRYSLLLCGLFGALATTIRYEGWVFAAAILMTVLASYRFAALETEWRDMFILGLILFAFPVIWAATVPPNPIKVIIADARQYSLPQVLRKNPLVEFMYSNIFSLNCIGGIAVLQSLRRGAWRYKAIATASFGPLLVASLILLFTRSAQTGPSWRMIGVWSMLLMPFTACFLANGFWVSVKDRSNRMLASCLTVLVLGAFVYDTFRIERDSLWAFPASERQAGQYLNERITADPATKILIESSRYFFLNIQVGSQHPDRFVRNSDPAHESVPILPRKGSVSDTLKHQGIGLLVFQSAAYKNFLDVSPDVHKLKDFGPWSNYELTSAQ